MAPRGGPDPSLLHHPRLDLSTQSDTEATIKLRSTHNFLQNEQESATTENTTNAILRNLGEATCPFSDPPEPGGFRGVCL